MCPPRHFVVEYEINPWMDAKAWARRANTLSRAAERQWLNFHDILLALGATVKYVTPRPDLPDLVFTANAAIVLDGIALLSRFRHPERKREQPVFAAAFSALKARGQIESIVETPETLMLEGAGDCIWDGTRGHFWMGFGPRSHSAASEIVSEIFAVECEPLELGDPRFYHLDTAFCPLPSGCESSTGKCALMPEMRQINLLGRSPNELGFNQRLRELSGYRQG
jgi:N-dimethylarginine dimethylaminohydrolase